MTAIRKVNQVVITSKVLHHLKNQSQKYKSTYNLKRGKFNINTCSQKSLMRTRQIGQILSNRIITHRPYRSMKELRRLRMIGAVRYQELSKTCYCP